MFVGDQHGIDFVGSRAEALEPARHLARTESGVDQQTGRAGLNQESVPAAAAAKRSKAHRESVADYFNCS